MKRSAFALVRVVRGRVEPPTFRFSGAYAASLHVARCGLIGDLAGQTVAGCRLVWPDMCGRWLPVWLPESTEGAAVVAWRLIAQGQVIGTAQVAHHRHGATMATKVTVVLGDHLAGGPADETVRFGIAAPATRST
jgi:hypothetical protein